MPNYSDEIGTVAEPVIVGDHFEVRRSITDILAGAGVASAELVIRLYETSPTAIITKSITDITPSGTGRIEDDGDPSGTAVLRFDLTDEDTALLEAARTHAFAIKVTLADADSSESTVFKGVVYVGHDTVEGGPRQPPTPARNGFAEVSMITTVAAELEDMAGLEVILVIAETGRIWALMTAECDSSSGGTNATGAWAVQINGVDSTEKGRFLSGTNDLGSLSVQGRSIVLSPGTYTVKGRHRRRSGNKTVETVTGQLFAQFVAS